MAESGTQGEGSQTATDTEPASEQAIELLKDKVPADRWPRLEQATAEFRSAVQARRAAVRDAGLNDPDELAEHLRIMRTAATSVMRSARDPDEFVECLQRAAEAVRNAPLQRGDGTEQPDRG